MLYNFLIKYYSHEINEKIKAFEKIFTSKWGKKIMENLLQDEWKMVTHHIIGNKATGCQK